MTLNLASMMRGTAGSMPKASTFAGALTILALLFNASLAWAAPIIGYPFATTPYNTCDSMIGTQSGVTKQFCVGNIANLAPIKVPSRASLSTTTVGGSTLVMGGYYTAGDLGAGAVYTACASGLQQIADASGQNFCLVTNGPVNVGWFGAYGDYNPVALTGHDDTAAIQAAANTGQDVVLQGLPCNVNTFFGTSYFGVTSTIALPKAGQKMTAACGTVQAMPAFAIASDAVFTGSIAVAACPAPSAAQSCGTLTVTAVASGTLAKPGVLSGTGITTSPRIVSQTSGTTGGTGVYVLDQPISAGSTTITEKGLAGSSVLNMAAPRQLISKMACDGGNYIGVVGLGCYFEGSGSDVVEDSTWVHTGGVGLCLCSSGGGSYAYNVYGQEWGSGDTQFNTDANFVGTGIYCSRADNRVIGYTVFWTGVNVRLGVGCTTSYFYGGHPFGGRPGGPARVSPVNILVDSQSGTGNVFDSVYLDNGKIVLYNPNVRFLEVTPLYNSAAATLTAEMFVYSRGNESAPFGVHVTGNGGSSTLPYVQYLPNDAPIALTGIAPSTPIVGQATYSVAAFTANNPEPTNSGTVTFAGTATAGYNGTFPVVSHTATTIVVANATTGATGALGTATDDWSGNFADINAVVVGAAEQMNAVGQTYWFSTLGTSSAPIINYMRSASSPFRFGYDVGGLTACQDVRTVSTGVFDWNCGASVSIWSLNGQPLYFSTTPTITSGLGTSPTIAGDTAGFFITAGTGSPTTTTVLTLPSNSPGYVCFLVDETNAVTARQTGHSATTATFTWSGAPTAADKINGACTGG